MSIISTESQSGGDEDQDVYYDAPNQFTMQFHSVCIVNQATVIPPETCVFLDKSKALQLAKINTDSRFKSFTSYTDALNFATLGGKPNESIEIKQKVKVLDVPSCPYSKPSQVLINKFAAAVQKNDTVTVISLINENPCYLINDLDAPTILKISTRHYGSHVCAQFNSPDVLKLILSSILDAAFIRRIHPTDTDDQIQTCCLRLLDLYLNCPDKLLNETPLHIACKYGHKEIIELLVTYPEIKLSSRNKHGYLPQDLIPKRGSNGSTYQEIDDALNGSFFVPIIEKEEHGPGCIGKPCDSSLLFSPSQSPIRAVAGPMTIKKADTLLTKYHTWRRSLQNRADDIDDVRHNINKGPETVFRKITKELNVKFGEHWPFLKGFVEIYSSQGLQLLEYFLRQKYICDNYPQHLELFKIEDPKVLNEQFKTFLSSIQTNGVDVIDSKIKDKLMEIAKNDIIVCKLLGINQIVDDSLTDKMERLSLNSTESDRSDEDLYNAIPFLQGNQITKLDRDVYKAIQDVEVDDCSYFFIKAWKATISDFLALNSAGNYSIC